MAVFSTEEKDNDLNKKKFRHWRRGQMGENKTREGRRKKKDRGPPTGQGCTSCVQRKGECISEKKKVSQRIEVTEVKRLPRQTKKSGGDFPVETREGKKNGRIECSLPAHEKDIQGYL